MSKQSNDFKTNLDELEKIVDWFESEDVELESALDKFERGLELSHELKAKLDEVENKVIQIREKFDPESQKSTDSEETTES